MALRRRPAHSRSRPARSRLAHSNLAHPRPMRPARLVAALAASVLLLLGSSCSTTGADEPTRSSGQEGYVGVESNLSQIPPAERKPVPTVSGDSLDGQPVSTGDYPGMVVVVNIWGSWCPPCRKEAPALQSASEQTEDIAQFIGITVKDNDPAKPKAFVRANQITYPSIFNPTGDKLLSYAGSLPPSAIPSTLVIDAQGRLAVRVLGSISERTLVTIIEQVAAGG